MKWRVDSGRVRCGKPGIDRAAGILAVALLWLPAGVVAMAVMRFRAEAGPAGEPVPLLTMAPRMAASLAPVAPCGLPLALARRRV